jgi:hypothetical protein
VKPYPWVVEAHPGVVRLTLESLSFTLQALDPHPGAVVLKSLEVESHMGAVVSGPTRDP